jgi:hypothetical protein
MLTSAAANACRSSSRDRGVFGEVLLECPGEPKREAVHRQLRDAFQPRQAVEVCLPRLRRAVPVEADLPAHPVDDEIDMVGGAGLVVMTRRRPFARARHRQGPSVGRTSGPVHDRVRLRSIAVATPATSAAVASSGTAPAATVTATAPATTATILARPGLVDGQVSALEVLAVQRGDGLRPALAHLHEAEATRAARLAVGGDLGAVHGAVLAEELDQVVRRGGEGEVPDVDVHVALSRSKPAGGRRPFLTTQLTRWRAQSQRSFFRKDFVIEAAVREGGTGIGFASPRLAGW